MAIITSSHTVQQIDDAVDATSNLDSRLTSAEGTLTSVSSTASSALSTAQNAAQAASAAQATADSAQSDATAAQASASLAAGAATSSGQAAAAAQASADAAQSTATQAVADAAAARGFADAAQTRADEAYIQADSARTIAQSKTTLAEANAAADTKIAEFKTQQLDPMFLATQLATGWVDYDNMDIEFLEPQGGQGAKVRLVSKDGNPIKCYNNGQEVTVPAINEITLPNYFDGYIFFPDDNSPTVQLASIARPPHLNFRIVAYVIGNVENTGSWFVYKGVEWHSARRNVAAHEIEHTLRGMGVISAPIPTWPGKSGNMNLISLTNARVRDEDLAFDITNGTANNATYFTQQISPLVAPTIFEYTDSTGAKRYGALPPSDRPDMRYNDTSATSYSGALKQVGSNNFVSYFLMLTTDKENPVKWIMGRNEHASADECANDGIPSFASAMPEMAVLYKVIGRKVNVSTMVFNNALVIEKATGNSISASSHLSLSDTSEPSCHPSTSIFSPLYNTDVETVLAGVSTGMGELAANIGTIDSRVSVVEQEVGKRLRVKGPWSGTINVGFPGQIGLRFNKQTASNQWQIQLVNNTSGSITASYNYSQWYGGATSQLSGSGTYAVGATANIDGDLGYGAAPGFISIIQDNTNKRYFLFHGAIDNVDGYLSVLCEEIS